MLPPLPPWFREWVVERVCRRLRVRRGPLVSRSPLLGALPQPPLKYPPATQMRMRTWRVGWGVILQGAGTGGAPHSLGEDKIIHLLFPHRPPPPEFHLSPFPEDSAVLAFEF